MRASFLFFGLAIVIARAHGIAIYWEHHYHWSTNEERLTQVTVDPAGNTYAVGTADNGTDLDGLVLKYGPGGSLHWASRFTGTGDQVAKLVAVSPDGGQVYAGYNRPNGGVALVRLNPANGQVMWTRNVDPMAGMKLEVTRMFVEQGPMYNFVNFPFEERHLASGTTDVAIYTVTDSNVLYSARYEALGAVGRKVLDLAARPGGGGGYLLIGDPGTSPPNSRILPYTGPVIALLPYIEVPEARQIAVGSANGGQLYAAGIYSGPNVKLYRMPITTSTIASSSSHPLSGATDAAILDLVVDSKGMLYAGGYETVSGFDKERYLAAYRPWDLVRQWRTPRPRTVQADQFLAIDVDAFGTLGAVYDKSAASREVALHLFEAASGGFLYYISWIQANVNMRLLDVAAHPPGRFSVTGSRWDGSRSVGLTAQVGPDTLKHLSTAQSSYVGGSNIAVTAWMYTPSGSNRDVTVFDDDVYLNAPSPVTVPAGATSKSFVVTSQPTATDQEIELLAVYFGSSRRAKITLLAPRPSSVSLDPLTVQGGNQSAGRVYLTGRAAAGGVSVALASSGPEVTVPPTLTIDAGLYSGNFIANTSAVVSTVYRVVSATLNGVTKTRTLTVTP